MRQGFSLIEMAIVIVIVGLLVGGIMVGRSLIRGAELQSVVTEYSEFQAAVGTFRDKYFALPGDFSEATAQWGAAHATPATCRTTASTGIVTCDGNGDEVIQSVDSGTTYSEQFRFWQHLVNAGLMQGQFSGVAGPGGNAHWVIGVNGPRSGFKNAGWSAWYQPTTVAGDVDYFEGQYGNAYVFGKQTPTGHPSTPSFTPDEQWNIDTKIDDGKPASGILKSFESFTNCNTTTVAATAAYRLDYTSEACSAVFLMQKASGS